MSQFWFNIQTRQVEEGDGSDTGNLMGPYASYEEAAKALESAAENTRRWDEEEAEEEEQ